MTKDGELEDHHRLTRPKYRLIGILPGRMLGRGRRGRRCEAGAGRASSAPSPAAYGILHH